MNTSSRTRKDFEEAFWRLYAKKSIERITVRELCEVAGYSRGTFYLHYTSIYDLLASAENDLLEQVTVCVQYCSDNMGKVDLFVLMTRVLALYERNSERIVILLGERGDASFTPKLKNIMKQAPIWRVSDPSLDIPDGERALLLEQTVAGVLYMITAWLDDPRGVSATRLLHLIYDSAIKRP